MITFVSNEELSNIISQYNKSQIFSVTFTKRTSGSSCKMVCRKGVHSYRVGGELKYEPPTKRLCCVFDFVKLGYRMINLDGLIEAKIAGQHYIVTSH